MDGAVWAGVYGCQGKAIAAAAFGAPTGAIQAKVGEPVLRGIVAAGNMMLHIGAVPIIRDGVVVGPCGVGGGTG